ncbi:M17 family peptidase N-terminal domain-containing protein, partial [Frankia sp. R82]|uniref:M17 family peptidase N-terminal domain-containing protein n=1 Tax=Frankia sp. R82 TaxID=2950553 RepID=UPI00255A88B1
MTTIAPSATALVDLAVDAVVIGTMSGAEGVEVAPGAGALDEALGGRLVGVLTSLGATGRAGEVVQFATLGAVRAATVVAVGLGPSPAPADTRQAAPLDAEGLRRAAGT